MPIGTAALVLGLGFATMPPDWSQWRGPARSGQVASGPAWPDHLAGTLRRRWRVTDLGPSYSGPLVVGPRVYTTATRDEAKEVVRALDRETGSELWRAEWDGAMTVPFFAARNGSWIRATPACDGERLYVAGMRDVLVCLDAGTGAVLWRADFVERCGTPAPAFGFASSPLVDDRFVYAQAGGGLVKLDKRSGEMLWRTLDGGGGMDSAFASPVQATIAGREQLVVQTRAALCGVDPANGQVLWERPIKSFRGMNILTPTIDGDRVFTAAYGGRAHLFAVSESDAEGTPLAAVEAWQRGVQGYMSTPVIRDGHVYLFTRGNRFTCLALADGAERWTSGPTGDTYWSLVARDDRILALNESGTLRLIDASPEAYRVIDEIQVADDPTWAHLALAGRDVIVREQNALAAWTWAPAGPTASSSLPRP